MVKIFKAQKRQSVSGQKLELDILRFDINGDGIARHGKKSVFVSGALPGEKVQARVTTEHAKYLRAQALKVAKPHAQRVTPQCAHFYQCGGCDFQHMDSELELEVKKYKIDEVFKRNAGIENLPWQPPLTAESWHYRRKARIGVQYNRLNEPLVGFRQKNASHITPIKSCPVLEPSLQGLFEQLQPLVSQLQGHQVIGHIEAIATDTVTLIFRYMGKLGEQNRRRLTEFAEQTGYRVFVTDDQQNHALSGGVFEQLSYQIDDCHLYFSPKDFIQVNGQLNQMMVTQAMDWLQLNPSDRILDLFCGLGNFSLPIARKVQSLTGIEGVMDMVNRAQDNAHRNQIDNCHFYQADLNNPDLTWPWAEPRSFTKVLLDPARAGALGTITPIAELGVDKVLYISCDAATMARDSQLLISAGYTLEKISLLDMFAQTRHVETMALFSKT
ncbi:23S rRNA (uracil(1939)-C(5))-methyltransferase RlmD [Thalassotalea litorea]|uniref:23S rRNA (uracil(1939)-C(5))-methyltransferase RlmD n=1 Tax=Thalassotalea litorea TaxID=2020715 RepID=A0A5R9IHV2_9GAMM|nr:23S rRNA (uracil(1939)-C(5))-methyltransferase RlmD [Thalassotalea litorea]TLU59917.1 23S rRNA (uracil(1939)-C(5))-methyltransferase RlmD [Thalassotalea litorea]